MPFLALHQAKSGGRDLACTWKTLWKALRRRAAHQPSPTTPLYAVSAWTGGATEHRPQVRWVANAPLSAWHRQQSGLPGDSSAPPLARSPQPAALRMVCNAP